MNFANGNHPGGGYMHGSRAQEEALCRQWPLYQPSLSAGKQMLYPFGAHSPEAVRRAEMREKYNRVLVTPDVIMLRAGGKEGFRSLREEEMVPVTMVAATAPQQKWWPGGTLLP